MELVPSQNVGKRICEALGLNPNAVARLSLDFEPGSPVSAVAQILVTSNQADAIMHEFETKHYMLMEVGKTESEDCESHY